MPTARPTRAVGIQAAINAVHCDTPTAMQTDWPVVALYEQLLAIDPSPIVALDRAVTLAEVDGPQVALQLVDELPLGISTSSTPSGRTSSGAWAAAAKPTPPTATPCAHRQRCRGRLP